MTLLGYVLKDKICLYYRIEPHFIDVLIERELIGAKVVNQKTFISEKYLSKIERLIRLHQELDINIENLDIVSSLLEKIIELQNQLSEADDKLKAYEENDYFNKL